MIAAIAPASVAIRGTPVVAARHTTRRAIRLACRAEQPNYKRDSSANDRIAQNDDINPVHWTRTQEVSNGRAAIAGLIAAFISERATGFATVDQLLGSSAAAPWAKPAFFAVVLTFIALTATERGATGRQPISGNPNSSPFSPELRLNAGRAAMVGFVALLAWEKLNGVAFFG